MELTISATTALRSVEKPRVDRSPASKQQDVLVDLADVNASAQKGNSKISVRKLEGAAERLNHALQAFDRDLAISIHDNGQVVVRVTDPKTGDVIREIPPERVLEVEENLDQIVGLFVNDQA